MQSSQSQNQTPDQIILKGYPSAIVYCNNNKSIYLFFEGAIQITKDPFDKNLTISVNWGLPSAAVDTPNGIFVTTEQGLFNFNIETHKTTRINIEDWSTCRGLHYNNGNLYAVCDHLNFIDPSDGTYKWITDNAFGEDVHTVIGYGKYILVPRSEGHLHKIDVTTEKTEDVSYGWHSVTSGALIGDKIYFIQDAVWLFKPSNNCFKKITKGGWQSSGVSCGYDDKLFTATESGFWETNLSTGEEKKYELNWTPQASEANEESTDVT